MRIATQILHFAHTVWWWLFQPVTVGVRVMLVKHDQIVLVRHTYSNGWYLPGGGVKKNETPEQALRREVHEELGGTLNQLDLFGVYSNFYEKKSDHIIVFACHTWAIEQTRSNEIAEVGRFPLHELPESVSPGTRRRIVEYIDAKPPIYGQ